MQGFTRHLKQVRASSYQGGKLATGNLVKTALKDFESLGSKTFTP